MHIERSGVGLLFVGGGALLLGWRGGYPEATAFAALSGTAVVMAMLMVRRANGIEVRRLGVPLRVERGAPIAVRIEVVNRSHRHTGPLLVEDQFDGHRTAVPMSSLAGGSRYDIEYPVSATRRGERHLGPVRVGRHDPMGLAHGMRTSTDTLTVMVHPRVHVLQRGQRGEQGTADDSARRRSTRDPASGVISLRSYVPGDDTRQIHWPTSARTGDLMVREFVDYRRPRAVILLDARDAEREAFEDAVDVAASLLADFFQQRVAVVLLTTDPDASGSSRPLATPGAGLDLLTKVNATSRGLPPKLVMRNLDQSTAVTAIAVAGSPGERLDQEWSVARLILVGNTTRRCAGHKVFAVADAEEFARRWPSER